MKTKYCLEIQLVLLSVLLNVCSAQCPSGCECVMNFRRLRCSSNGHTEVPTFPESIMQTATTMELQNNFITSIRATDFEGFTNLVTIDLSNNQISSIENGSFSTNMLENLDLHSNRLREIPDNLFENSNIFALDLSNNRIENVSFLTFMGVENGAIVNLQRNLIRRLPEGTFDGPGWLHSLDLSMNPIQCDCELRWFLDFRTSGVMVFSDKNGACLEPMELNGVPLNQVTADQLLCDCTSPCINGTCNMTVGECDCDTGCIGSECNSTCPDGLYGTDCLDVCECMPDQVGDPTCNHINGTCNCLPGYSGISCEDECPDGTFGANCLETCSCKEGRVGTPLCDNVKGTCNCLLEYTGSSCQHVTEEIGKNYTTTTVGTPTTRTSESIVTVTEEPREIGKNYITTTVGTSTTRASESIVTVTEEPGEKDVPRESHTNNMRPIETTSDTNVTTTTATKEPEENSSMHPYAIALLALGVSTMVTMIVLAVLLSLRMKYLKILTAKRKTVKASQLSELNLSYS